MLVIAAAVAAGALQLPEPFSLSDPVTTLSHYFSPTANWLVPRHVLVGRYPGSCPSRYLDEATQSERITLLRTMAVCAPLCACSQSSRPRISRTVLAHGSTWLLPAAPKRASDRLAAREHLLASAHTTRTPLESLVQSLRICQIPSLSNSASPTPALRPRSNSSQSSSLLSVKVYEAAKCSISIAGRVVDVLG